MEISANNFAAELLMPSKYINEAIDAGINTLDLLADLFGVSSLAVKYRVNSLGYSIKDNK
jgi:Zn-dependent peptidase ImmA (M78 family)